MKQTFTFWSPVLGLDWNCSVAFPAGYDDPANAGRRWPLMILLHGAYGNHTNLPERIDVPGMLEALNAEGALPEFITVFPDGFNSYYIDGPTLKMETAIIRDLIPYFEHNYPVCTAPKSRVIGGISMGGYGAVRLALKYPELFSMAAGISPALWEFPTEDSAVRKTWRLFGNDRTSFDPEIWERFHPLRLLSGYSEKLSPVSFLLLSGGADTDVPPEAVLRFSKRLSPRADVITEIRPDGIHAWTYWKIAMERALRLIGNKLSEVQL